MATGIPARLTPAAGRNFGFSVGGAFLALSGIAMWRGHAIAAAVLGLLGGGLGVGGLIVPDKLGPVMKGWMGLAHALSKVTTPVFMGIIYFVLFAPVGLIMRVFGRTPLRRAENAGGFWVTRHPARGAAGSMERQF